MKIKYIGWILIGLVILFAAVSCKSQPPAEEPPPVVETAPPPPPPPPPAPVPDPIPTQADYDALNSAAARAAAARKLVSDFDGPSAFPVDWESSDALYSQAEQQKSTTTQKDAQDSTVRYIAAAEAFESLSEKTLARYYDETLAAGIAARAAAVDAGALDLVPDLLFEADDTAIAADDKYQAKDYYAANDSAVQALAMYGVLKDGLNAYSVREELERRDFLAYDSANVEAADEALWGANADYGERNLEPAEDKVEDALFRYNQALKTAWQTFASEKGEAAASARQDALDAKANVALRQEFNEVQTRYTRANTAFQAQRYEEAASTYDDCVSAFDVVSQAAMEKRRAAEEALERANQKMTQSDEAARAAEVILEGGTR